MPFTISRAAVRVTSLILLALAGIAPTAAAPLAPGEYAPKGGDGTLTIQPAKGATQAYSLFSMGANGHTCDVDGTLRDGVPQPIESAPGCKIAFSVDGSGIEVRHNAHEDCHRFCGMRAGFAGRYLRLPASCTSREISAARKRFQVRYNKRDYAGARAALKPLFADCEAFLSYFELGGLRNDLAITQFHLGDKAGCLATLAPLKEEAQKSDDELLEQYPPFDGQNAVSVARAARTNLRKCGGEQK